MKYSFIILIVCVLFAANSNAYDDEISVFLQTFDGKDALAPNVTTFLELQLMKTLRVRGPSDGMGVKYGRGRIYRNKEEIEISDFAYADSIAMDDSNLSQGIVWGKAWYFNDGVAIQSYLSLPKYDDYRSEHNEIWEINLKAENVNYDFIADIPQRRNELPVIVLPSSVILKYTTPDALPIYSDRSKTSIEGYLGHNGEYLFTALEHKGDYSKIRTNGKVGWIYLPYLTDSNNQIVYFVGGMIRLYRGDFFGANDFFEKILSYKNIPTSLRVNSLLCAALSKAKAKPNLDFISDISEARKINPYSKYAAKYMAMGLILKLKESRSDNDRMEFLSKLDNLIKSSFYLFDQSDTWFRHVNSLLEETEKNPNLIQMLH